MKRRRPLIGITTRYEVETERFYLARYYAEAVEAQGALPVYLPLLPRREYLAELGAELDGLLLSGSASDVDPLLYGHEPHPKLGAVHPLRDETDARLLELAERRGLPVLAICYGMQMLNVTRGGTLIQDIEHQVEGAVKHEQGAPRARPSHRVKLLEGSRLAQLRRKLEAIVNSHHHQGVETVGRNLVATAWTADGLVEAVEDPRADRYVVGVQWHPELGWAEDEFSAQLFASFVAAASVPAAEVETTALLTPGSR